MSRIAITASWAGALACLETGPKTAKQIRDRFSELGMEEPRRILDPMAKVGYAQSNGKRNVKALWSGTEEGFKQLDLVRALVKSVD